MRGKKAVYNIISNLILQIVTIVYGFIVPKVIISNFGSEVNGLISSITQFLAYITLLESGFGPVVKSILYKPIAQKDNKTIASIIKSTEKFFRTIAYIFLAYIVVLCLVYPLFVNSSFDFLFTVSLIIIIAISTFAEYFFGMTYRLFLQANQKSYVISIIQIVTYILSTIVIIVLAKLNASVQVIKLSATIIFIFRPLLQNYYVKKKYKINIKEIKEKYEIKQKWDGLAQHVAAVIHGNTDITLLTLFCSLSEVSVYSVYYLVVKGVNQLIKSFSNGIEALFGDMIAKKEHENLNEKFNIYEILFFMITTIVFSCTIVMITPFVNVYTKGVTDVDYNRLAFGILLVVSEYICMIRLPYASLTYSAGHFKETRIGAWVECLSNIIISIILVWKFGLIGVTIGTIIAMTIRTIEFIYHSNKYILKRNILKSVKKIVLMIIETIAIVFICNYLPFIENNNYLNWFINALMVLVVAVVVTLITNKMFYYKDVKNLKSIIKIIFKRNKSKT